MKNELIIRPTETELLLLEVRCSYAEGKGKIHQVESALKWIKDLLKAPIWNESLQTTWEMYKKSINEALAGLNKHGRE